MTIRLADRQDVAAIAMLEGACFPDPWPEDFIIRRLDRILVAEQKGFFLGYAALDAVLDEGNLDSIAVTPEHRRHGVADALLTAAEAWGRARSLRFITLEVRASNGPAIALYEKHGYAPVGRRKNYYEKPREDAILMTLVLQ